MAVRRTHLSRTLRYAFNAVAPVTYRLCPPVGHLIDSRASAFVEGKITIKGKARASFAPFLRVSFTVTAQPLSVHCFNGIYAARTLGSVNIEENRTGLLRLVNSGKRLCLNLKQLTLRKLAANFCHFFFDLGQKREPISEKLTICLLNLNQTPHFERIT